MAELLCVKKCPEKLLMHTRNKNSIVTEFEKFMIEAARAFYVGMFAFDLRALFIAGKTHNCNCNLCNDLNAPFLVN